MPQTFLTRLRTAGPYLVVGVHAAALLLGLLVFQKWLLEWSDGFFVLAGFPPAQAMMLAAWAVLGRWRPAVRISLAAAGVACLTVGIMLVVEQDRNQWLPGWMFCLQVLLVLAGSLLGARYGRWMRPYDPKLDDRGSQFSIRNMFLWTAMAAVTLALLQFYPSERRIELAPSEMFLSFLLSAFTAGQVLIVLWWLSHPTWRKIASSLPTAVLAVGFLAVAEPLALVPFAGSWAELVAAILTAYTLLQGLVVLITLLLLRLCRPFA